MSKRAEERAFDAYPFLPTNVNNDVWDDNREVRQIFQQGYEQAEKDKELTWEDIKLILELSKQVTYELHNWPYADIESWAVGSNPVEIEVLRRFNELKK